MLLGPDVVAFLQLGQTLLKVSRLVQVVSGWPALALYLLAVLRSEFLEELWSALLDVDETYGHVVDAPAMELVGIVKLNRKQTKKKELVCRIYFPVKFRKEEQGSML